MLITRYSRYSGICRTMDLPITEEEIELYNNGALIQNAFPHLTPDQREFYMTGITSEEWDDLFKTED